MHRHVENYFDHTNGAETNVALITDVDAPYVEVTSAMLGAGRFSWREPNATEMRDMVDHILVGTGLKRTGRRWVCRNDPRALTITGCVWRYDLTKTD